MSERGSSSRGEQVLKAIEDSSGLKLEEIKGHTGFGRVVGIVWRLWGQGKIYQDNGVWKMSEIKARMLGQTDREE